MSEDQLLGQPDGNEAEEALTEEDVEEEGDDDAELADGNGEGEGLIDTQVPDEEYAEFSEDPEPDQSSLQQCM